MLPTPTTSHVQFDRIYEPAEDSYLLLDTLSSVNESSYLSARFPSTSPVPLVVEIGTGSGVVLAFVNAHAQHIFGRDDICVLGVDVNIHACKATRETVRVAQEEVRSCPDSERDREAIKNAGTLLGAVNADLTSVLRASSVDVLIFNPPYVPTPDLPSVPQVVTSSSLEESAPTYEDDSAFLALSYAGGEDGMEVTNRLLDTLPDVLSSRGVAYVLLCAQNKPDLVLETLTAQYGQGWNFEIVGRSGRKGGWERLCILRIARSLE